jgi:hypothetical protein
VKAVAWVKVLKLSKPFMHRCRTMERSIADLAYQKPPILQKSSRRYKHTSVVSSCSGLGQLEQSDLPHIVLLSQQPRSASNNSSLTTRKESRQISDFLPLLTDPCNSPAGVERIWLWKESTAPAAASQSKNIEACDSANLDNTPSGHNSRIHCASRPAII